MRFDRSYYRDRAEVEIEAAHGADHPIAARAHYTLAAHYLDLAYNPEATVRALLNPAWSQTGVSASNETPSESARSQTVDYAGSFTTGALRA